MGHTLDHYPAYTVKLFQSPEAEFRKPRPAGLKEKVAAAVSAEISFDQVELGDDFPGSKSSSFLLRSEDMLE